ncbi:hypothetical protein NX059_005987 [Plenodomus lindquistii]|nr:hypothetical protein NX059_005987 [Plenodomus lindquistii]
MADESHEQLLATVQELLTSGNYSDLTVKCGNDVYKVHKNIVCSRADFFARAIKFGGKEAEENEIELPEDQPEVIKLLMQYLYESEYEPRLPDGKTSSHAVSTAARWRHIDKDAQQAGEITHYCTRYVDNSSSSTSCPHNCTRCSSNCVGYICDVCLCQPLVLPINGAADQLLYHSKLYEIADKYNVTGLKELAKEKFWRASARFWDDPAFAVAAHHAFSTTPDHDKGLRDIISKTIAYHTKEMVKKREIEALLTEFNGLAFGLLKACVDLGEVRVWNGE